MQEVAHHEVGEERIAKALDDIEGRAWGRWHSMRYDSVSPRRIREFADELLDHVAARALKDPTLDDTARSALRTAAECHLGVLSIDCWPNGDQELVFPLAHNQKLTSEEIAFRDVVDEPPTVRGWLDTFATCLVSGLVWDWQRVTGLLLRDDFASEIHKGAPYSEFTPTSEPGELAAMDALCLYLTESNGHLPRDWPTVPLRKPDAEERAQAAGRLDTVGALTPDQRLLRVLLDDDRHAFEQALAARLVEYRESVGADPAPRTLLPLDILALAALAVQTHGWELDVRSGYLPQALLGTTDALQRAASAGENNLGVWHAK
ncbi:immunity 49 family protein [Streptomyces sp. NPDC046712]|uniref:immunity 49 family protein n=1 Tax=Streptomyces sp. NPDC046712 TaxID=3154802 RepID=UPI0033CEE848